MNKVLIIAFAGSTIVGATLLGGAVSNAQPDQGQPKPMAHHRGGQDGKKLELASEVLGVEKEELESLLEDQTFKEVLEDNGYDEPGEFFTAMEPLIREALAEKGLSEEEINSKIEFMRNHHKLKADVMETRLELMGVTHSEIKELHEQGLDKTEILAQLGFDSVDGFHEQLKNLLVELWSERGVDQESIEKRIELVEDKHERLGQRREKVEAMAEKLGVDPQDLRGELKGIRKGGPRFHR